MKIRRFKDVHAEMRPNMSFIHRATRATTLSRREGRVLEPLPFPEGATAIFLDRGQVPRPGPQQGCIVCRMSSAGAVVEEILLQLLQLGQPGPGSWRDSWRLCLTPRLQCAPAAWDPSLLRHMAARCPVSGAAGGSCRHMARLVLVRRLFPVLLSVSVRQQTRTHTL